MNQGGVTRYASVAVDSLSPGDVTAVVRMPTQRLCVYTAADWLGIEEGGGCHDHKRMAPAGDSLLVLQHFFGAGPPLYRAH